jgi:succinate dehydrogenase (ubiquinone) cytochrome b560 subunit
MKEFWVKNQKLNRPSSPWIIYKPHLPMLTSLCHRTTGIVMGVTLYGIAITTFVAPGDFPLFIDAVKNLELPPAVLFLAKSICAFPLVYHYVNGIRHLTWDTGRGFELRTQYKTGWAIVASTVTISVLLGSMSYW